MKSLRMKNLHPYVPGEQPKDRVYLKLNANENPYSPAPKVIENICKFINQNPEKMGLYPDPDSNELKQAIASMLNQTGGVLADCFLENDRCKPSLEDTLPFTITPDMIYCGNGSDEVLSFIFYAFFDSGNSLVLPKYTYSFYPVYAGFYNIPLDTIPMNNDWSLNVDEMVKHSCSNNNGIIFANPNAPTGLSLSKKEIAEMIKKSPKDKVFVVDEAYVDFGGESCLSLLADFKNLVIVRTFSKSFSGAGMRLGYLVSNPELVNIVTTVKNSLNHFPIDTISQKAGIESCKAVSYYAECAKKIVKERDSFISFLQEKHWFVIPSKTNFVFTRPKDISGCKVYEKMKQEGILVRRFDSEGIEEFLRITIGTEEQMERLKSIINTL